MSENQTYASYYKEYFAGKGRAARRKAENKYRAKKRAGDLKNAQKLSDLPQGAFHGPGGILTEPRKPKTGEGK